MSLFQTVTKVKLNMKQISMKLCLFQSTTKLHWKLWQVFQSLKIISSCDSAMACKLKVLKKFLNIQKKLIQRFNRFRAREIA